MNSKDFLVINNGQNSNDYGLYVDTPAMFPMAEQKTTVVNIPDREETLYVTHEVYEDITYPITGYTFTNDYNVDRLYEWLRKAKKFWFNNNPKYYFKVKKLKGITPSYSGHGKNVFKINFVVSPFKYFTDDPIIVKTSKEFVINNGGNYFCRPIYEIYGNGDITIENGVETLKIFGVNGSCLVDSQRLVAHKDGVLLRTEGYIPFLYSGNNSVKITGNATTINIQRFQRDV